MQAHNMARYPKHLKEGLLAWTCCANLGKNWTADHDPEYVLKEFSLMNTHDSQGWLEATGTDRQKNEQIPRAYLTHLDQNNNKSFQVIHSRARVHTPETEVLESNLEDNTWVAEVSVSFVGEQLPDQEPAVITLRKEFSTVQLLTKQSAKLSSALQAVMTHTPSSTTGTVKGPTEAFTKVPTILPLPWSWAAAILAHPNWTIQTGATRYIIFKSCGWNIQERTAAAVAPIMKVLMGTAMVRTPTANK
jgi:hypothetical protein